MLFTKINKDQCISCGACVGTEPNIYVFDDMSISENQLDNNTGTFDVEEYRKTVEESRDNCPVEAVLVQDAPFN